jgi:polar amino acid transport system substrate-binding protein
VFLRQGKQLMQNGYLITAVILLAGLAWVVYGPLNQEAEPDLIVISPLHPETPAPDADIIPLPDAPTLTFVSDPWMPYTGTANAADEGYAIDVLREIYEPLGYKVEYVPTPWSQALDDVENGAATALVCCHISEAPRLVYPQSPIAPMYAAFFVRGDSPWGYAGTESLEGIRLGVIQDYTYAAEIDAYIRQHSGTEQIFVARGTDALTRLIVALEEGRIDAFVENRPVGELALRELGIEPEAITIAGGVVAPDVFVAFSPALGDARAYADIFDKRLAQLQADGRLDEILAKYGMGRENGDQYPAPEGDR